MLRNTENSYGRVAIFMHWLIALLVFWSIFLGLYMTRIDTSPLQLKLFRWHKEFGVLILILVSLRLGWRFINITPSLAELPLWERAAARAVHWLFYLLLLTLPIIGWLASSAAGIPVSFFGLFTLPDLISANEETRILLMTTHKWLAYTLIAFIGLHIAAALKHHFVDKDEILRRMF